MILNSYNYDNEWSTSIAKGIGYQLELRRPHVKSTITYAGLTGHTSYLADRFAMQGAFSYGRLSPSHALPDVLVLIGDEAWMIYRSMFLRGTWDKIPIVLCGVHDEVLRDYADFFKNRLPADSAYIPLKNSTNGMKLSAVLETDHSAQALHLAHTFDPKLSHIYYLSSTTYADAVKKRNLLAAMQRDNVHMHTFTELSYSPDKADSIAKVLAHLPYHSVVLTNGKLPEVTPNAPVISLRDMRFRASMPHGGYFSSIAGYTVRTAQEVIRFLDGDTLRLPRLIAAGDTAYYLNGTAMLRADLSVPGQASLSRRVDRNIPPPFAVRHARALFLTTLLVVLCVFISLRWLHISRYRAQLRRLLSRYKSLYDEYLAVYENMPVSLITFNSEGKMLSTNNPEIAKTPEESLRALLLDSGQENRILSWRGHFYYLLLSKFSDAASGQMHTLVTLIDHTNIEKEKREKETIYNVFSFAMNRSAIGVALYNLMDTDGFATAAWYQLTGIDRTNNAPFSEHERLSESDARLLHDYLRKVRYGTSQSFLRNLQVNMPRGESRYVRFFIQPMEFIPEQGRVVVAEMVVDMDAQVKREQQLEELLIKARRSEQLKNAFIANMRNEIRTPLNQIAELTRDLVNTDDMELRAELNIQIAKSNDTLLGLVRQFINASHQSSNKEVQSE
jgi:PAS domain-containing protein